jgi:hypothetical protein
VEVSNGIGIVMSDLSRNARIDRGTKVNQIDNSPMRVFVFDDKRTRSGPSIASEIDPLLAHASDDRQSQWSCLNL